MEWNETVSDLSRSIRHLEIFELQPENFGSMDCALDQAFRVEKRNKHTRVLTVPQAPSLKKWRDFGRSSEEKRLRTLYAF